MRLQDLIALAAHGFLTERYSKFIPENLPVPSSIRQLAAQDRALYQTRLKKYYKHFIELTLSCIAITLMIYDYEKFFNVFATQTYTKGLTYYEIGFIQFVSSYIMMYWTIHSNRDSLETYLTKASPKLGVLALGIYCLLMSNFGGIFYCTTLCVYLPKSIKGFYNIRKDSLPEGVPSNFSIIISVVYTASYILLTGMYGWIVFGSWFDEDTEILVKMLCCLIWYNSFRKGWKVILDCREEVDRQDFVVGGGDVPVNENNVLVRRQRHLQQEKAKKIMTGILIAVGFVIVFWYVICPLIVTFWVWGNDSGFFEKALGLLIEIIVEIMKG